jgi:predicted nucleotidyltransferase
VFSRGGVTHDQVASALRLVREPDTAADQADRVVAERLKDLVIGALGDRVRRVILFGSRARGDARPDSDYDLLVVLRELRPADRDETLLRLYRLFREVDVVVEPHVMGEEEFEETRGIVGSLAHPAAKEGVVLYENA